MNARTLWATVLGTAAVLDIACDRRKDGSTLSNVTRQTFHTDTNVGRVAFVGAWLGLTTWFVPHILDPLRQSSPRS